MKQEINFLKSLAQPPVLLPGKWITITILASIALFTLISLSMGVYQVSQYVTVNKIHAQNVMVDAKFTQLKKLYPLLANNPPLIVNIALLEKRLKEKKAFYETLTRVVLRHGFSDYLATLANIVPSGLWLYSIMINQDTKSFSLSGYVLKPVEVSLLLQALQQSKSFAEVKFEAFYIKKVPEKTYVTFKIANTSIESR